MHRKIAQSNLWDIAHKMGIAPTIKPIYWYLKLAIHSHALKSSVNDVTLEFKLRDGDDFTRVSTLMGEQKIISKLLNDLQPDDIFFDVGANIGVYSCFAMDKISRRGAVYAFEPETENIERLNANLSHNGSNWSIIDAALGKENEEVSLQLADGTGEHHVEGGGGTSVRMRRAETLISKEEVQAPTLLKIDIEGGELDALRGFGEKIGNVRVIYCEVHPYRLADRDQSADSVETYLTNSGFDVDVIGERGSEYHIRATNSRYD